MEGPWGCDGPIRGAFSVAARLEERAAALSSAGERCKDDRHHVVTPARPSSARASGRNPPTYQRPSRPQSARPEGSPSSPTAPPRTESSHFVQKTLALLQDDGDRITGHHILPSKPGGHVGAWLSDDGAELPEVEERGLQAGGEVGIDSAMRSSTAQSSAPGIEYGQECVSLSERFLQEREATRHDCEALRQLLIELQSMNYQVQDITMQQLTGRGVDALVATLREEVRGGIRALTEVVATRTNFGLPEELSALRMEVASIQATLGNLAKHISDGRRESSETAIGLRAVQEAAESSIQKGFAELRETIVGMRTEFASGMRLWDDQYAASTVRTALKEATTEGGLQATAAQLEGLQKTVQEHSKDLTLVAQSVGSIPAKQDALNDSVKSSVQDAIVQLEKKSDTVKKVETAISYLIQQGDRIEFKFPASVKQICDEMQDLKLKLVDEQHEHRHNLAEIRRDCAKKKNIDELYRNLQANNEAAANHIEKLAKQIADPHHTTSSKKPPAIVFLDEMARIEANGNLSMNLKNGNCEVSDIPFVPRKPPAEPTAEFVSLETAKRVLADVAALDKIFQVPIQVEGHTRHVKGGQPDYWQQLAENRAKVIGEVLENMGVRKDKITCVGLPGYKGMNKAGVMVKFDIFPNKD